MKNFIIFLTCTIVFFSCKKENIPPQEEIEKEWQVGKNEFNKVMDGEERNFLVHVPQSYTDDTQVPLLFMLHGSSGTGTKFYNISGWVQKSEEENFIAVFPTALEYPIVEKNNRLSTKWSIESLASQIPDGYPIKDDVPFFDELINWCKEQFNIDPKRIYISGFSGGGEFVKSRIIDEMNDRFAAASAGNIGLGQVQSIKGRLMPLFQILGSKDPTALEVLGIEELPFSVNGLLQIPQIANQISNLKETFSLGDNYTEDRNPPKYNLITWDDDLSGQGNESKVLFVNDLEHKYPNGLNNPNGVKATDFLWDWFMKYTLPE